MGATSGAGTTYPSTAPQFIPVICGVHVAQSFVFCILLHRLLSVLFDLRLLITPLVSLTFLIYHKLYYAIKTKTHLNLFKYFILKLTNYGVKPLIHQSELRTYTKVVPFKETRGSVG